MSVGAAFEVGSHSSIYTRQFLLFWLGICIREGSVENFEECVLSSYRAVAFTNGNSQDENLSDEIRASLLSFTKEWAISEAPIKIWCAEAPLFGFLCETRLFRDPIIPNHLSSLEIYLPLLSASEIPSSAFLNVWSSLCRSMAR